MKKERLISPDEDIQENKGKVISLKRILIALLSVFGFIVGVAVIFFKPSAVFKPIDNFLDRLSGQTHEIIIRQEYIIVFSPNEKTLKIISWGSRHQNSKIMAEINLNDHFGEADLFRFR